MRNKKGFELSINFIVTSILAITIFVLGISFGYKLWHNAQGISDMAFEQID